LIVADGSSPWYDSGLVPTVIAVAALIVGWLQYRLSVREARRARSNQRESHALGYVIAVIFGLVAGGLFYRKLTETTPETTPAVTATGAAACPSPEDFRAAQDRGFVVVDTPPDSTRMVLQAVTRSVKSGTQFVVTICRDSSSSYWYFSREKGKDTSGLVTTASLDTDEFNAPNGQTIYRLSSTGGSAKGGGVDVDLDIAEITCAESADVPESFVTSSTPNCDDDAIDPWSVSA